MFLSVSVLSIDCSQISAGVSYQSLAAALSKSTLNIQLPSQGSRDLYSTSHIKKSCENLGSH